MCIFNKKLKRCQEKVRFLQTEIEAWSENYHKLKEKYDAEKRRPKMPGFCRINECPFNPNNQSKKKSRLRVRDGGLFYGDGGTEPIVLIGASSVEALPRVKGIPNQPEWRYMGYDEYVNYLKSFKTNYVRQMPCKDMTLNLRFQKDMYDQGKVVEWTFLLHWTHPELLATPEQTIDAMKDKPNVFFTHNEFSDHNDVQRVRDIVQYGINRGCIMGAGAWGHSTHGKTHSDNFDPIHSQNQIITHHRNWTKNSIQGYTKCDKPVIQTEFFDRGNTEPGHLGWSGFTSLSKMFLNAGCQGIQYYPFIGSWKDREINGRFKASRYLEFLEGLCQEYN